MIDLNANVFRECFSIGFVRRCYRVTSHEKTEHGIGRHEVTAGPMMGRVVTRVGGNGLGIGGRYRAYREQG